MDVNRSYPQFIEHSFRRLSLLIRQQDQANNHTNDSSRASSSSSSIERRSNHQPVSRTNRTYMRPPKRQTTTTSHQSSERSASCLTSSMNHSSSSENSQQKDSNELPVHVPCERTLYDVKFEKDRQNDVREKFDIPPPFERKWLRQPRYVPQERPVFGQIKQFQHE